MFLIKIICMYWPFLALIIASNALYMHLSYSSTMDRTNWWFYPATIICGLIPSLSWTVLLQIARNNAEKFIAGQIWDIVPVIFFCVLPPFFYEIGLTGWKLWMGIIFIIVGTLLISYADQPL